MAVRYSRSPNTLTASKPQSSAAAASSPYQPGALSAVLADAKLSAPAMLAGNPGHWEAAMSALFCGVVLDAVPVDDPAVSEILSMLGPVVREELARADGNEPGEDWALFQELNAPLFRFADWPDDQVPRRAAGVYTVWRADEFIYVGMSGRGGRTVRSEDFRGIQWLTRRVGNLALVAGESPRGPTVLGRSHHTGGQWRPQEGDHDGRAG